MRRALFQQTLDHYGPSLFSCFQAVCICSFQCLSCAIDVIPHHLPAVSHTATRATAGVPSATTAATKPPPEALKWRALAQPRPDDGLATEMPSSDTPHSNPHHKPKAVPHLALPRHPTFTWPPGARALTSESNEGLQEILVLLPFTARSARNNISSRQCAKSIYFLCWSGNSSAF